MRVLDAATIQGDGQANQDRYLVGDYYAAVLDGASAWPPQPADRDGGWYADQLGQAIEAAISSQESLRHVLAKAIQVVADAHGLVPGSSPSSTVALARWNGAHVECLLLGDSTIVVERGVGKVEVMTDDLLGGVAPEIRAAYRERLVAGRGYDEEHQRLLHELQEEQRHVRNTHNGYWIAEADPTAAHNAHQWRYPHGDVSALVLMSDGAAAIVHPWAIAPWSAIPSMTARDGCAAVLNRVVGAEDGDPNGEAVPRSKGHDDKTAVLITA